MLYAGKTNTVYLKQIKTMHLLSCHSEWSIKPLLKRTAALENGG